MSTPPYILERVRGRPHRTKATIQREDFTSLDETCVSECLTFLQDVLALPIEQLKAADDIVALVQPPKTRNPVRWYFMRSEFESVIDELESEISYRERSRGQSQEEQKRLGMPRTLEQIVRRWCV